MAIKLVQICRIDVAVVVDQRDARKTAMMPSVIDHISAELRERLPEPHSIKVSDITIVRRRFDDSGEKAGRDSAAKEADTMLTPLEEAILAAASDRISGPEDAAPVAVFDGGEPVDFVVEDGGVFFESSESAAPVGSAEFDMAGDDDSGPGERLPWDDMPPMEEDTLFEKQIIEAAEEDEGDSRMGTDEDPSIPRQPARGAIYRVGEDGNLTL